MTRIKKEKGLPMACPNCGQPTIEGAKFCASCGSPLTQTTAAAPQAPAAPESDDGTMLSSAPHMAPAPQMPTAAVPLPNSAAPAAPQTTVPQPTTPQPAAQAQPTAQAQATQTVAPQAAPTQQFQYAPSPAPQPAAAPQPSQLTQQIARPAADPTITALTTPQSMKTMGASLGIGLGASVVFALLASIVFFMGNAAASNGLAGIPGFSDTASFLGNNGVSGSGPNFFQILFTVMTLGVGGSLNLKTSSQGFSLSNLGIDASHVSVTLPVGLPGVALAIGAAFGAYMLARRFALRFKWTGVISSLIVGVLSGLVLLVFAAIFPVTVGGSYSDYSASASLSGVSFRTFCMAFLLSAAGALAGYALAQYAGDSGNVFSAAWRWAHRARGFVRTLVESFAIYGVLFLVLGLAATIAMSAANHLGAGGLLLVPLLFPALPLMLISLSSFGGIVIGALIVLGIVYGVLNSTVFSAKSVAQSYLTAIADGKYGKANGIADPQVGKDQLKLLSDAVAKADNATIANPHIDSVKTVEGVAKVNVTYSLNGKNVNDSLTINKDGSKFLLFPNWKISSPLLKTITVSVPNAVESLSVNGVDVTAKNAEKSDSGTWTLRVYPGSYKVSIGKSGYVTSGITMVRTNADSDAADLKIMPTAKLKEDLSKAVNAKLDECAKSTDYAPEGCPFGFDLYDEDYYRNFAWSISVYPKLSDIDLDYGTFSTRQGKAKCTYEEKHFDDSWESQDDSTHFTVNGSFSIRDGKLSVTIDDED